MSPSKKEVIRLYADHVSPGKVDVYAQYGMLLVPGRREGCFIYDRDGTRYLNCHCNGGVFNLGHRNPRVIRALTRALTEYDIGNHHLVSEPKAMLARMLARTLPAGLNQVVFGVGGGEAIDLAIKLARGVTGRPGVISAFGGYHGHTGLALATGDAKFREKFGPMPPGFFQVPFGDIGALESAVSDQTAAVIMETIPATLGIVVPGRDYFRKVKALCARAGALLVMDEVQTGFGRTGTFWCFEQFRVVPDIVVTGKGMSGGIYPMSATIYHERHRDFFRKDPFVHISTFGGSEAGCFAAMEAIRISSGKKFLSTVRASGDRIRAGLGALAKEFPGAGFRVRGLGLMLGLEFADEMRSLFMLKLLFDRGVYMVYSGNDRRVLQLLPPLIITRREIAVLVRAVRDSLVELVRGTGG
ncbi:MAG: aspartate aminotransferase family protein [Spirochaetes bacterium]|nr:MAG: aspartate aminotransferase family protein [Spirochaetota bacterium]